MQMHRELGRGQRLPSPCPRFYLLRVGCKPERRLAKQRQTAPDSASDATRCLGFLQHRAAAAAKRQRYLAVLLAMTSCVSGTRRHEIAHKPGA